MAIFFTFSPTSNHLHPLQVENCDSNSRLVVNEDDNVNSGLKGFIAKFGYTFTKTIESSLGNVIHSVIKYLLISLSMFTLKRI